MGAYSIQEERRVADVLSKYKYQCKRCGRKELIRYNQDRVLCTYCGHYIYKSEELEKQYEFKEKMLKQIREEEKNEITICK